MSNERDPDDPITNEALEKAKINAQDWLDTEYHQNHPMMTYLAETTIKLADEIMSLRKQVQGHCDRISAQSELLSKKAEKRKCQCGNELPDITICAVCAGKRWTSAF
jgi:hypothetical protein